MGRSKESRNVDVVQTVYLSRCPKCGKTDRAKYRLTGSVAHAGTTSDGQEYTHVVRRRTKCLSCGKPRIDRFFENRAPEANPGDENEPEGHDEK